MEQARLIRRFKPINLTLCDFTYEIFMSVKDADSRELAQKWEAGKTVIDINVV